MFDDIHLPYCEAPKDISLDLAVEDLNLVVKKLAAKNGKEYLLEALPPKDGESLFIIKTELHSRTGEEYKKYSFNPVTKELLEIKPEKKKFEPYGNLGLMVSSSMSAIDYSFSDFNSGFEFEPHFRSRDIEIGLDDFEPRSKMSDAEIEAIRKEVEKEMQKLKEEMAKEEKERERRKPICRSLPENESSGPADIEKLVGFPNINQLKK
jgi:hypothetical protein